MTTLPPGPPPASTPRRRVGRPLLITGVVALVVGAGAGAAAAVTGSSSPSPSPSAPSAATPTPVAPPRLPFHGLRGPGGLGVFGLGGIGVPGTVHGEFVVPKPSGGYQTVDTQRGQVTAVSAASITLKSPDGFVKTYTVTASTIVDAQRDGIGSVKVGDQATVTATVSGGTATAASIADLSNLQGLRQRFFGGPVPPAVGPG